MLNNLLQDVFGPIPTMEFWVAVTIVTQEAYEKCLADQAHDPANAPACAVVLGSEGMRPASSRWVNASPRVSVARRTN